MSKIFFPLSVGIGLILLFNTAFSFNNVIEGTMVSSIKILDSSTYVLTDTGGRIFLEEGIA